MSRYRSTVAWFALIVVSLVPVGVYGAASAESCVPRQARSSIDLSKDWRFRFGGDAAGVTTTDYDDSGWQAVSVPHTWNRLGEYTLTRSQNTNKQQGTGWYRLRISLSATSVGERRILQFDGVGAVAQVWVNGIHVGYHRGAFSRFRFDITDQLRSGDNVIVVSADNSKPASGSTTQDVIPLAGDFFIHGGLYRDVALITVASAQIDMFDHGGPGVYLRTPRISESDADVEVLTRLRNLQARSCRLSLVTTIFDASGAPVASDSAPVILAGQMSAEQRRTLRLTRPHLWQGRKDPYLYSVAVELREGDQLVDRVVQPLGVRQFAFDPDKGFQLNGEPLQLIGASRHQDRADRGWALTPADHVEDMAIMAEMGLNTVRHAHYQHAQEWSDAADRTGMVVWAELGLVHEVSLTNEAATAALADNARSQLIELIRQHYNHPSIVTWSIGNEIDMAAAVAALTKGVKQPARALPLLKALDSLAKQEDPTRPTVYADCCQATPLELNGAPVLTGITDLAAFNRYFGWYWGTPDGVGEALDDLHRAYRAKPILLSEFGAGGAFSQHTDNPEGGEVNSLGRPHPEEYQSWVHERTWAAIKARPYLAGAWIWLMFDYATSSREEGEAIDLNDKGLVSYDRKSRKDAFYFYKASLSSEPVLHITGRRYVDRAYPVVDVRAYSNAGQANLTVNGLPIGEVACPDRICVWPGVVLQKGRNEIVARAVIAGQSYVDTVTWNAPDPEDGINILVGTLTGTTTTAGTRLGSDNFFTGGVPHDFIEFGQRPPRPTAVVTGDRPELYTAWREGDFSYDLPLPDGSWLVTLAMFEPDSGKATRRRIDVTANGEAALTNFSPAIAAGGALKGVTRSFPVVVRGGRLRLDFRGPHGAVLSAISVSRR